MWQHGLDMQCPLDYFVINVFFCFHHQEELGGLLFIFVGNLGGFNFYCWDLLDTVFLLNTNVRIFSNCFLSVNILLTGWGRVIIPSTLITWVAIMALINCHVMGFPPDVFNKTYKTFFIRHYRRLLPSRII